MKLKLIGRKDFFVFVKWIIVIGLLFLVFDFLKIQLDKTNLYYIFSSNSFKIGHNVLFVIYLVFIGVRFIFKYKINTNLLLVFVYSAIAFVFVCLISGEFVPASYNNWYEYYYTLIVIIVVENLLRFFPLKRKGNHKSFFIPDKPWFNEEENKVPEKFDLKKKLLNILSKNIPKKRKDEEITFKNDFYGFGNKAKVIADQIKSMYSNNEAFCIAITGEWGVGKTSFINMIDEVLKEESNIIRKTFSPWKSIDNQKMIDSFFVSLREAIAPYSPAVSTLVGKYSKALTSIDKSGITNIVSVMSQQEKSYETYLSEINDILARIDKKLVIYFDDIDRLDFNEIMEVFKIIRNTANLHNTVFICAFDRDYVFHAFKENKIINPNIFIEKIFQFELNINPLDKEFSIRHFFLLLHKKFPNEDILYKFQINKSNVISSIQPKGEDVFFNIPNFVISRLSLIRNAKRAYNYFCFAKELIGEKTLLNKLLVLELLKTNNFEFYSLIPKLGKSKYRFLNKFYTIDTIDNFTEITNEGLRLGLIENHEQEAYSEVLKYLGEIDVVDNKYNLALGTYGTYFEYIKPKFISLTFINLEPANSKVIIRRLEELNNENVKQFESSLAEVRNTFFYTVLEEGFDWNLYGQIYFEVLIYVLRFAKYSVHEDFTKVLKKVHEQKLLENSNINKDGVMSLLTSFDKYELNYSLYTIQDLIFKHCYDDKFETIFSKAEAQIMSIKNLKYIINSNNADYIDIEQAFTGCVESVDNITRHVTIMSDALIELSNYIYANPKGFIEHLFRPTIAGMSTFFPYIMPVFNENREDELLKFINTLDFKNQWSDLAKRYVERYIMSVEMGNRLGEFTLDEDDKKIFYDGNRVKNWKEIYGE